MKNLILFFALLFCYDSFAEFGQSDYELVAASQTNQALGPNGAKGDILETLIITPTTVSPGVVNIKDGTGGTPISIFSGGTNSLTELKPISVRLNMKSVNTGGWLLSTGANLQVIAIGSFH